MLNPCLKTFDASTTINPWIVVLSWTRTGLIDPFQLPGIHLRGHQACLGPTGPSFPSLHNEKLHTITTRKGTMCIYIYSCYIIYIYIITYTLNLLSRNVRTNKLRISVRKFSYVQSRPEMWIFQLAMFKTRCSSSLALCSRCLRTGSSVHGWSWIIKALC